MIITITKYKTTIHEQHRYKISCDHRFQRAMAWLANTANVSSLQRAAHIINRLEPSKFPLLLNRITQTLQHGSGTTKPFSTAEMEKLQTSLMLEEEGLSLLLDSITFIFEKAACHMTKPAALQLQLVELLSLDRNKAEMLAGSWASSARRIVDHLRLKSVFPAVLEGVSWKLNLQTASSVLGKEKLPNTVVQFQLKSNLDGVASLEDLNMEFDHEELYQFYNQLEKIQSQIDSLH